MEQTSPTGPVPGATSKARVRRLLLWGGTGVCAAVLGASAYGISAAATSSPSTPAGTGSTPSTPPGPHAPRGALPSGRLGAKITALDAQSITVTGPGGKSRTIETDASTTYEAAGTKVDRSLLAVGELVAVRPTRPAGAPGSASQGTGSSGATSVPAGSGSSPGTTTTTPVAAEVSIVGPSVQGTVQSVSGTTLVVVDSQGFWRTVVTSGTTVYAKDGAGATASDASVGTHVVAVGTIDTDHTTLDAFAVGILTGSPGAQSGGTGGTGTPAASGAMGNGPGPFGGPGAGTRGFGGPGSARQGPGGQGSPSDGGSTTGQFSPGGVLN